MAEYNSMREARTKRSFTVDVLVTDERLRFFLYQIFIFPQICVSVCELAVFVSLESVETHPFALEHMKDKYKQTLL